MQGNLGIRLEAVSVSGTTLGGDSFIQLWGIRTSWVNAIFGPLWALNLECLQPGLQSHGLSKPTCPGHLRD
ncbi:unnamed protein product [Protopolystoma xenopodis]|uniref:Uncharacterized protein n=1 Tax=Protopolystoma xenopodis TaxID=117903 RepID=A0A448XEC9_9PLAT|nr:unnamed protein product [Protopolystoma xenopodis]